MASLFGPVDHPGDNLKSMFGGPAQQSNDSSMVTTPAENLASRYMAWMALGGTLQKIPADIIHQIEATRILGQQRPHLESLGSETAPSANMLNLAKGLCRLVLPGPEQVDKGYAKFTPIDPLEGHYPLFNAPKLTPFVRSNGDFEMWVRLCSEHNRTVVRVYSL